MLKWQIFLEATFYQDILFYNWEMSKMYFLRIKESIVLVACLLKPK